MGDPHFVGVFSSKIGLFIAFLANCPQLFRKFGTSLYNDWTLYFISEVKAVHHYRFFGGPKKLSQWPISLHTD